VKSARSTFAESVFDLAPNPRFFYANGIYQKAFLAMRYGIKLRRGLIVVTGPSGTGKSSLIALVKERREANTRLLIVSGPDEGPSVSLTLIRRALGLAATVRGRHAQLDEIRRYLVEQLEKNQIVALIVDRAHELGFDEFQELESLLELNSGGQPLLPIALAGRPELEAKLADATLASLRRRVAFWCRIEPLPADEVHAYIDHRLACAGHQQPELFETGAVARIAAYSKGIPGLINTICHKALFSADAASDGPVTAETIDRLWGTLQRTGENEFEVAALLAEIRHYSWPAERHSKTDEPGTEWAVGRKQEGEFPSEEIMNDVEPGSERNPRSPLPRLPSISKIAQPDLFSRLAALTHVACQQVAGGWGVLRKRMKQRVVPQTGSTGDRRPTPSNSRWLGWSAMIAVLLWGGLVAFLFSKPSADPRLYNGQDMRQEAQTRQADKLQEQKEALPPAIVQPPVGDEVPGDSGIARELDGDRNAAILGSAGIPQNYDEQPARQENASIQALSSPGETTRVKDAQLPATVYVHTADQRDHPVLEEIGGVLRVDGYAVRDTRLTYNKTRGDVRFFFPQDRRDAERVKSVVQSELGRRGYSLPLELLQRDGKRFKHAAPGKIEVWLPALGNVRRIG
jgi:type II secretory pathway predicted ATPase ExeA